MLYLYCCLSKSVKRQLDYIFLVLLEGDSLHVMSVCFFFCVFFFGNKIQNVLREIFAQHVKRKMTKNAFKGNRTVLLKVYFKRKEFASSGSKFFSFKVYLFQKAPGVLVHESKRKVTKVISLVDRPNCVKQLCSVCCFLKTFSQ